MGSLRSWLFRLIYPLPQKGEDLLAHKQTFTEEYISFYRLLAELKGTFVSSASKETFSYVKNKNDSEQKQRLEAYKTWQKMTSRTR